MHSPGRNVAHPDLNAFLTEYVTAHYADTGELTIHPGQFRLLQQRTLCDAESGLGFKRTASACLAMLRQPTTFDRLIVAWVVRGGDSDAWRVSGFTSRPIGGSMLQPFNTIALLGPGSAMIGAYTNTPEIAAVRFTLADGTTYLDEITNDSALLYVAQTAPGQWGGEAMLQPLDRQGQEVLTYTYELMGRS